MRNINQSRAKPVSILPNEPFMSFRALHGMVGIGWYFMSCRKAMASQFGLLEMKHLDGAVLINETGVSAEKQAEMMVDAIKLGLVIERKIPIDDETELHGYEFRDAIRSSAQELSHQKDLSGRRARYQQKKTERARQTPADKAGSGPILSEKDSVPHPDTPELSPAAKRLQERFKSEMAPDPADYQPKIRDVMEMQLRKKIEIMVSEFPNIVRDEWDELVKISKWNSQQQIEQLALSKNLPDSQKLAWYKNRIAEITGNLP